MQVVGSLLTAGGVAIKFGLCDDEEDTLVYAHVERRSADWEPTTRRWWAAEQEEAAAFTMAAEVQGVVSVLGDERRDLYLSERFASHSHFFFLVRARIAFLLGLCCS